MDATPPPLVPPAPTPPAFQDRSTGLMVMGILTIFLGLACALFVPLTLFGQMVVARQTGTGFDTATAFISCSVYGLMAVALIWLGVGSILARRWARALLLCLGWIGLLIGLIAMPAVFMAMSTMGETLRAQGQNVPPAALAFAKLVALVVTFVIYIVIPGVAVLFYRSPHVQHTCEVKDPVTRWTDRCPLPVLGLCLIQAAGAVTILFILPVYGQAFPLAGLVIPGWPSRVLWLGALFFMAYSARGFYRLEPRAWWIYTAGTLLMWASSLVTFQRLGIVELYRQMGMAERQLQRMGRNPMFENGSLIWISLLSMAVFLGYLLYVKRYFRPKDPPAAA